MSVYREQNDAFLPSTNSKQSNPMNQNQDSSFEALKELLLDEERKEQKLLQNDLQEIKRLLGDDEFRHLVTPIIREHLDEVKEQFPQLYGEVVRQAIATQVKDYEDEMVNSLYPIMGKMTKQYINAEFRQWMEGMSKRADKIPILQKIKAWWKRQLAKRKGKKRGHPLNTQEQAIQNTIYEHIEEIFIIDKYTGFILASYSEEGPFALKKEMLVGLLTALKSFGEDAMGEKNESLNTIQFDAYTIITFDFHSYYAATVVNGPVTEYFKSDLLDKLLDYAERHLKRINTTETDQKKQQQLSEALKDMIRA